MAGKRRGRQRRVEDEPSEVRCWAFLTRTERAEARKVAARLGVPLAVLIRDAVNDYVTDIGEQRVFASTGNSRHPAP